MPPKKMNCCECSQVICDTRPIAVMCHCKHPICSHCYDKHRERAKRNSWYGKYVGVCDTCIWFDIG